MPFAVQDELMTYLSPIEPEIVEGEVIESPVEALAVARHSGGGLVRLHHLPEEENPVAVYLSSLGEKSRRVMLSDLNRIAAILTGDTCKAHEVNWGALRFQHTAAIRAALAGKYNHNGANRMLCALRGVLKAAWRLGQIDNADYQKAVDIGTVKGESLPAGRALSPGEMRTLFNWLATQKTKAGSRDSAEMAVLYGAGLRRDEIVNLDIADVVIPENEDEPFSITVRRGKGSKARVVYATGGSREALHAWLEVRGMEPGPLFVPILKNDKIVIRRMTGQAIYYQLAKRALEAGIKDVSPHDMRRTFMSDLLDAGADIVTVKDLAGHSKIDTTARYDRRGEGRKKKAAELLHVPFVK